MTDRQQMMRRMAKSAEVPLPGHFPVLTMQLNYTRYHPQGTCRWVLIVREPVDGLEIDRVILDLGPDTAESDVELTTAVLEAITQMLYLQTGSTHKK